MAVVQSIELLVALAMIAAAAMLYGRRTFVVLAGAALLSACAATQSPAAVAPAAPGFWLGLWHGFIFPVAWIVSLFTGKIAIYAVPNSGGWYDFGYFLGIVVFGVGARKTHTVTRDRIVHVPIKNVTESGQ
jgi:hypothetical protein